MGVGAHARKPGCDPNTGQLAFRLIPGAMEFQAKAVKPIKASDEVNLDCLLDALAVIALVLEPVYLRWPRLRCTHPICSSNRGGEFRGSGLSEIRKPHRQLRDAQTQEC
jgi:hypothetical protein